MTTEIDHLIADVAAGRQRVIAAVAGISEEQAMWQPAPGEWSVAQVVEHLVLAEQSGIIRMWQAVVGLERGQPVWQGEPVHRGKSIEQNIAETWREREEAPPNATPQTNGPLAYWIASLAACEPVLVALGQALAPFDLEAVIAPHFLSGPLDARQRFEFLRWHMDHHRQQIAAIMARQPGQPR
jgi:DinB superfamily